MTLHPLHPPHPARRRHTDGVRPLSTDRSVGVAVALAAAAVVPGTVLVVLAVVLLGACLVGVLAREARRDPFRLREPRPDDPRDLLAARLVGFRR